MRESPAFIRQPPGFRLLLLMLGIASLGVVAGLVRAAVLDGAAWWRPVRSLPYAVWLLLPVVLVAALCLWVGRRSPGAALGGGVAAALAAAVYSFELLHPKYNQDANIGLGLYLIFGWLFPLGPAVLVGGLAGLLEERLRGRPPSLAALEDTRPLPPLAPWLWPLMVPGSVSLAVSSQPLLRQWGRGYSGANDFASLLYALFVTGVGALAVSLFPALIALLALRGRAARDGTTGPRLAAFRGLCLGLAVTLGLFGFGQFVLVPRLSLEIYLLVHAAPPVLGYAVGWWLGRRESAEG